MNLSRLLLAGVLVSISASCKKEDANSSSSDEHAETRTKSSLRQGAEVSPGRSSNRNTAPLDSREAAELIDAAETAHKDRQVLSSALVGIAVEESLAKSLNNEAEMAKVQERIEEATQKSAEAELTYLKTMDALRSRQKKDPEDGLAAYIAFATHREQLAARQKEIAEIESSNPDAAAKAREELLEETAKLRELRAAWKGETKASETPPEPGE